MDSSENNLPGMLKRLKHYYRVNKGKIKKQFIITFILVTLFTGRAGQVLNNFAVLSNTASSLTWNPFIIIYYAWIKMLFVSGILFFLINFSILYITINLEDPYYDKERNIEMSKKGTFGTGGFMKEEDKEEALIRDDIENITGPILGKDLETGLICSPKPTLYLNGHKTVCGGSGARKTTAQALNDALQIIKRGESFIGTDPKGELTGLLSNLFEEHGYVVRILNLVDLINSDSIDFIKALRDKNGNKDKEFLNVLTVADVIMKNTSDANEAGFWKDFQQGLLTAAILYVMYDETGNTKPTLSDAYDLILNNDKNQIDALFNRLSVNHPAKAQYNTYAKAEDKVRSGVISGLTERLQIFQSQSVKKIISEDEIDLTLPGKRKCAYFIIMSDQESTFDFISSLFFSMFFIQIVRMADSRDERCLEIPVNMEMDEFPSIGTIPDFGRKLATLRSRKIFITIIFQNYGQMIDKYEGNEWKTIVTNCDTNIYLGGNDPTDSADFYIDRMGKMTIISKNKKTDDNLLSMTNNKFHQQYTTTEGEAAREVMTKDEFLRLDINHCLVYLKSCRPVEMEKFIYDEHPLAKDIVEKRATSHIPKWRRIQDGIPLELTDEELKPVIDDMMENANMGKYLQFRSHNRKYDFMQYLYEFDKESYDLYNGLLMERKENTTTGEESEKQEAPAAPQEQYSFNNESSNQGRYSNATAYESKMGDDAQIRKNISDSSGMAQGNGTSNQGQRSPRRFTPISSSEIIATEQSKEKQIRRFTPISPDEINANEKLNLSNNSETSGVGRGQQLKNGEKKMSPAATNSKSEQQIDSKDVIIDNNDMLEKVRSKYAKMPLQPSGNATTDKEKTSLKDEEKILPPNVIKTHIGGKKDNKNENLKGDGSGNGREIEEGNETVFVIRGEPDQEEDNQEDKQNEVLHQEDKIIHSEPDVPENNSNSGLSIYSDNTNDQADFQVFGEDGNSAINTTATPEPTKNIGMKRTGANKPRGFRKVNPKNF